MKIIAQFALILALAVSAREGMAPLNAEGKVAEIEDGYEFRD